jgi:AcrR family transcriptional regulator
MSAGPARRAFARLPREQRVGDIIEAARAAFAEHGYESASMSAIADRAGVVEGTIYKYFENKRDLLNRVLAHWYEGMLADEAQQLAGIAGTRNRLRYVIWRHLATIAGDPALCRVFFQEVRAGTDYRASPLHDLNRGYTRFATQSCARGSRTASSDRTSPSPAARPHLRDDRAPHLRLRVRAAASSRRTSSRTS